MHRLLFVCGKNRLRSPTAEQIFAEHPGLDCLSAGVNRDADTPVSTELVEWADWIVVMEKAHLRKLRSQFKAQLRDQRLICLGIPDDYGFMDPALVSLLKAKMAAYLPRA